MQFIASQTGRQKGVSVRSIKKGQYSLSYPLGQTLKVQFNCLIMKGGHDSTPSYGGTFATRKSFYDALHWVKPQALLKLSSRSGMVKTTAAVLQTTVSPCGLTECIPRRDSYMCGEQILRWLQTVSLHTQNCFPDRQLREKQLGPGVFARCSLGGRKSFIVSQPDAPSLGWCRMVRAVWE